MTTAATVLHTNFTNPADAPRPDKTNAKICPKATTYVPKKLLANIF